MLGEVESLLCPDQCVQIHNPATSAANADSDRVARDFPLIPDAGDFRKDVYLPPNSGEVQVFVSGQH